MKPTALQMLARQLGGPATDDAPTLLTWAEQVVREADRAPRVREVAQYLIRASGGRGERLLPSEAARGSLKHLLWWLRDHAGSLYEAAAAAVLREALAHPDWPLATLAERLRMHPLLGGLTQQALASAREHELARHLLWEDTPRGRAAWNRTTLNLAKIAFRAGATYYCAVSADGGCLMGARGTRIDGFPAQDGWTQPYPNLCVLTRPGTLADEATIRAWLLADTKRTA